MCQKIEKMNIKLLEMMKCINEKFINNVENQIFLKKSIKKKSEHILTQNYMKKHQKSKKKF